jgi:Zinc finger, C3HC4 type (RING finger)
MIDYVDSRLSSILTLLSKDCGFNLKIEQKEDKKDLNTIFFSDAETTMAVELNGEEIDQNLYLDLGPLAPNGWHYNPNHPSYPLSQTQPTFMVEDSPDHLLLSHPNSVTSTDPVLLPQPNFNNLSNSNSASVTLNSNPSIASSSSAVGMILEPDDMVSTPVLRNHHRDTVLGPDLRLNCHRDNLPGLLPAPTMLVPVEDLVLNGSRAGRVSRARLHETPQLRFLRIMEANRSNMSSGMGASTDLHHPDTNPEILMSNILALQASRRERLKNGRENGTTSAEKKNDEGCQCCANFECNICFENSVEPVVTACGHLFCWRCLYKWISSTQLLTTTECPVCKGEVTESNLTPIYGRGGSSSAPDPVSVPGEVVEKIPPRPSGRRNDSTRQLLRREREVRGRGYGPQDVERVRMDLEAVLARLRQVPRSNRAAITDAASEVFPGGFTMGTDVFRPIFDGEDLLVGGGRGEVQREGDGPESEAGPSTAGEMHVRRRRRYR